MSDNWPQAHKRTIAAFVRCYYAFCKKKKALSVAYGSAFMWVFMCKEIRSGVRILYSDWINWWKRKKSDDHYFSPRATIQSFWGGERIHGYSEVSESRQKYYNSKNGYLGLTRSQYVSHELSWRTHLDNHYPRVLRNMVELNITGLYILERTVGTTRRYKRGSLGYLNPMMQSRFLRPQ